MSAARLLAAPLLLWLWAGAWGGAEERVRFGTLTTDDGLSRNWVQAILRDSRGFLWLGTQNGLNRYDGHRFTVYRHRPDDPHSLPSSVVGELFEDSRGRIWVGSGWGRCGAAVYDRDRDRFVRIPGGPGSGGLGGDWVHAILEDGKGRIWIGTENGLDRVDLDTGVFDHHPLNLPLGSEHLASVVFALHEDRQGTIWVGSRSGLLAFDPETGEHRHWEGRPDHPDGPDRSPVWDLLGADDGRVWVATIGGGLYLIDPQSGEQARFVPRKGDPTSLSHTRVRRLARDHEGRIWVGTENGGLNVLDPDSGEFTRYVPSLGDENSISSASIWALHVDEQGIVWVGTYNGGLNFTSRQAFDVIRARPGGLTNPHVTSLMESRNGDLWIGTDGGGLNRVDGSGRFTHYRHDPEDPRTLGADAVFGTTEDRAGAIWVGTWDGGLSRLDPETGRVTRFRHDANDPGSVVSDEIWKLLTLATGEILVTTPDGVDLLDPHRQTFRRLASVYPEVGFLQTGTAAEDAAGNLWLGTRLQGVQHIERSSGRVTVYRHDLDDPGSLGPGWVSAIHIDSEGNAWFGTEGGLGSLPRGASRIRRFTSADGLPADNVLSILEDDAGSLWLGTPRGLSRFVDAVHLPEEPEFVNYGIHDGLQGLEFAADAALRTSGGLLYFGGERGLSFFDPTEIRVNPEPPPVVLTDLRIFNESVVPGAPGSPLERSITEAEELTLSRDHAVVTFEFAALDLLVPQKNQYAYRLEGLDRTWNQVGTEHVATYAHLPPGRYVFRVRASNSDGVWNEEGVSLRIHVTPRWYERPIVPLAALALVAIAGVARYRWRVRALRTRERELSRRVDERTSELHRLNEDLEDRVRIRTAELAAEKERLAVTLRSIGDGVIATDVEGRIVLMNRIAETLTGWSFPEAEGEPLTTVLDVIDQTSRKPPPDPVAAIVSGKEWALPTRSLLRRRDGTDVLIADSVAAIRDSQSRIVGVVLVFRDVTESRKVEEQLQNAQKLEGLGVLAGGIAHDFNNLLMGIFGYLSMAERHCDDPRRTRGDLERAASVLERARGLTRQLLTFSQERPPDIAPLALDGLLRNAMQFALSGSNVQCSPAISGDLWPCRGDEQQIGQVVDNLLLNARQAMPGGGEIRLVADNVVVPDEVQLPLEAGRYVRVRIQDSGPGIPPDLLPRIFEPFFTTKVTGSGLGLATAYSIVSQHGGHIDVSSAIGHGTTFSVYLPASDEVDVVGDVGSTGGEATTGSRGARRVLVLDDEDYVREIVQDALRELGHEVEAVTAGEEAVDAYRAAREAGAPFDVVILDLTIPGGMGGQEALEHLQRLDPTVRAVASSGYSGDPAMIDPEGHGFASRLTKPYTVAELEDVVACVLDAEDP